MAQTKRQSWVEVLANQVSGIAVALLLNVTVMPLMGFNPTPTNLGISTAVFFAAAMIRMYALRRFFNLIH